MSLRHDLITWTQIGVGYVILLCIGAGMALALLDPQSAMAGDPVQSMVAFAVFAVASGLWALLRPPLRRASARLAPTPEGQLRMKRRAVGAMWLLSLLLCLAAVRVTQLVNPW